MLLFFTESRKIQDTTKKANVGQVTNLKFGYMTLYCTAYPYAVIYRWKLSPGFATVHRDGGQSLPGPSLATLTLDEKLF